MLLMSIASVVACSRGYSKIEFDENTAICKTKTLFIAKFDDDLGYYKRIGLSLDLEAISPRLRGPEHPNQSRITTQIESINSVPPESKSIKYLIAGRGDPKNEVYDESLGLYKIYSTVPGAVDLYVFSRVPSALISAKTQDNWSVATCTSTSKKRTPSCRMTVIDSNLRITINIRENQLKYWKEIENGTKRAVDALKCKEATIG
jgi:aconitase A